MNVVNISINKRFMLKDYYKKITVIFAAICFAFLVPAYFDIGTRSLSYYGMNALLFILGYGMGYYDNDK